MNASLSYREMSVQGASPVRLVVLLYEQAIADLRRALSAHREKDIEARTREINHALLVIGYLQGSLNLELGGAVASNLERFYGQLRSGLVQAQCEQSERGLEQQISNLTTVYEAWRDVDRATASPSTAPPEQPQPLTDKSPSATEWKA